MFGKLIRYAASMLPLSLALRAWLYRISGIDLGNAVSIDRGIQITEAPHIHIGDRVTISAGVSLLGEITSVHSRLETEFNIRKAADIVIEDDAYIGVKATILPGVRIGRMATIGANTLVISDVPPFSVVLGVPGRVVMVRPHPGQGAPPTQGPTGS
ncbi:MAG: acyltransferase [Gemmatimonadota bacterium]